VRGFSTRWQELLGPYCGPVRPPLSKDTRLCISLAGRPSNIGTRFHNHLYDVLGLDFVYKAFTTTDIVGAIAGVRALGIRGCSVSMPFKEAVIPLVDGVEDSATAIGAVNTIVNDDGRLSASNTDYIAVRRLVDPLDRTPFLLHGSGGMAKAVATALVDAGFGSGTVAARNEAAGRALASSLGLSWAASPDGIAAPLLVNATPIGMSGGAAASALAFSPPAVETADTVLDVVAMPALTPLVVAARTAGKRVITGAEVIALQAAEQFERYTGVRPTPEQVREASELSRR
jgi:shikimate dehydrogenase